MDAEPVRQRTRARLTLVALFALFFIPVFGAVLIAVVAPHWIPFGRINHGELLQPAVADALRSMTPLDDGGAIRRGPEEPWVIAHLSEPTCEETCQHALVQMRQARLALGKDAHRVERWWLVTERPEAAAIARALKEFPGLRVGLVHAQSPLVVHKDDQTAVLMVDPIGFLVLKYAYGAAQVTVANTSSVPSDKALPVDADTELASAIRKDFKRLLKVSGQR